jgi:glucose/arabinose dehydrogenase
MKKVLALVAIGCSASACAKTEGNRSDTTAASSTQAATSSACGTDNGGITLPDGFCATVFADTIGHARDIAVASNGDVYVNTWSGRYYGGGPPHPGGFLIALRDTNSDGKADIVKRFGPDASQKNGGGTGVEMYKGALYAEEGDTISKRIVRYAISTDSMTPTSAADVIVAALPASGGHPMHPFVIDGTGNLFMDVGSASNSCQMKERTTESPGHKPCTELQTRAGIWKFDANKTNQRFSPAERYATGIRNAVGIALDPGGHLYSTQHGRDQLAENWPKVYTPEQGQNLPAEELLRIEKGDDYGWPYCYFDGQQQKLVLAPEYGGDGKAVSECASKKAPEAYFPAHWAPDGLLFYTGTQFPAHYKGGAFIAFHGSWNRAPAAQQGYQVVFVPYAGGKPGGASQFETFANDFAGGPLTAASSDQAKHRPVGLAQGPDGSLYITDDKAGRVWKVVYRGGTK